MEWLWVIVPGLLSFPTRRSSDLLLTLVEAVQSMFVLAGQKVKVGGVVSLTVIVWTQLVLALPQASVAVNRRERVKIPVHLPGVSESQWVIGTDPQQSSVAVAVAV